MAPGLLSTCLVQAQPAAPPAIELKQANMKGLGPDQSVSLPHMLASKDFHPEGSLVTYTLRVDLAALPDKPLGIYVQKMALSGKLYVNGHLYGACERGALKDVRCLHRPYLFAPSATQWRTGSNELRFEIYANARQSNGLSAVWVGDVDTLEDRFYRWRYWLQVDLLTALTWLSGFLGLLALAVGLVLRQYSMYILFGLTSLCNALASSSVSMSRPMIDAQWFSWLVFSSRFVCAPLVLLVFSEFFEKLPAWFRRSMMAYAVLGVALIGATGSNRSVVIALYVPVFLAILLMPIAMLRWTWQTRQTKHFVATLMMGLIAWASGIDWFRFTGDSAFVGVYLIPYAYNGVLLMFGGMLLTSLARSLIESQNVSADLESKVAARTAELKQAHTLLLNTEIERSRAQERESLLQDVHDGFGSQLVLAKMLVEKKQMSQAHLAQLLQECIGDLYLIVDTLGNKTNNYLPNALIDFRHRTQRRLEGIGPSLHWDLQIDRAPEVPQKHVLQILRIVLEALNNALKHAAALNIWIDFTYDEDTGLLTVTVADDGVGLGTMLGGGQGKANMMARARDLGAALSLSDRNPGTLVQLRLPLERAPVVQADNRHHT